MEDYGWAREYLRRHDIHGVWEACMAELVLHQHTDKDAITKCVVDVVEGAERRKTDPAKDIIFCIGLPDTQLTDVVAEVVAGDPLIDHVQVGPNESAAAVGVRCNGSNKETVVVTGFPRTIEDAIAFESRACVAKACVVFASQNALHDPASEDKERLAQYWQHVNPVAAYYRAVGRLVECAVDSAKTSPLAVLRDALK